MKITYFPDSDTLNIRFRNGHRAKHVVAPEEMWTELDHNGYAVSFTIGHASQQIGLKPSQMIDTDPSGIEWSTGEGLPNDPSVSNAPVGFAYFKDSDTLAVEFKPGICRNHFDVTYSTWIDIDEDNTVLMLTIDRASKQLGLDASELSKEGGPGIEWSVVRSRQAVAAA